jgi:hypothetical protein
MSDPIEYWKQKAFCSNMQRPRYLIDNIPIRTCLEQDGQIDMELPSDLMVLGGFLWFVPYLTSCLLRRYFWAMNQSAEDAMG